MTDKIEVSVPDIGDFGSVEIIEISVNEGDVIEKEDTLITLETDKAAMEIPSPYAGTILKMHVKEGDKVSKGSLILDLSSSAQVEVKPEVIKTEIKQEQEHEATPSKNIEPQKTQVEKSSDIYASPSIRRYAREMGVDLARINGSGRKDRITKQDLFSFVKGALNNGCAATGGAGLNIVDAPQVDFSKFGDIEEQALSRIKKLSGKFLHRNWVTIPHVTQFDKADITELEDFRKAQKALAEKHGVKLTPLVFLMKAAVAGLKQFPIFNSSLDNSGEKLIMKKYFHIGVAVDTPNGLVVPVVRDVDQKGLFELAKELGEISKKAREGKLTANDMQGGCFTISSLGGIGGTSFTPIVNAPEVSILGVSRSSIEPVFKDGQFVPRLMLPVSLSYDHRVIDGADGARFTTYLVQQLSDIRRLLL